MANGESLLGTGQAPAISPTTLGVSMSKAYFSPTAVGGGADDEQGDDDKVQFSCPEGVEILESAWMPMVKMKSTSPEVSFTWG